MYNEYYRKRGDEAVQDDVIGRRNEMVSTEKWVSACVRCGECEAKCPQQIPIRSIFEKVIRAFEYK